MKRILRTLFLLLLTLSHLLTVLACQKNVVTDSTAATSQEQMQYEPKTQLQTVVNKSKQPSDYEVPNVPADLFSITCVSYVFAGNTNFIDAFADTEGGYTLVIPYSVGLENVALYFNVPKTMRVLVDSRDVDTGIEFFDFSVDADVELYVADNVNKTSELLKLKVYTTQTPLIYLDIDEKLGTMEQVHADLTKNTHCYGIAYVDSVDDSMDLISHFDIHGHGNSTWKRHDKKPYNIKFTEDDSYSDSRKVSVLGLSSTSRLCLLADVWDETMTKTTLAHYLGEQVGMAYAIQTRYVYLYIGSVFSGLYVLAQKPAEIDEVLDLDLATGDNMDGSWVLEFDNFVSAKDQILIKKIKVTVKSSIEGCEYNALKDYLNEVRMSLEDPNGYNKQTGKYYYDYIDIESYAKYVLIREFSMDNDTVTNNWAYYDIRDQKLHAGPLWDFDNAFGNNTGALFNDPKALLLLQDTKNPDGWLVLLMKHEEFVEELKKQYTKYAYLFDVEDERSAFAVYESWYTQMNELMYLSDLRWGYVSKTREYTGFEYDNSHYAREYSYTARFLYRRCRCYGEVIMDL